ncbi:MAG: BrnA antitoxin family protein [Candidatus Competibacteraceae bacterium]
MRDEYDFSQARRGPVIDTTGKTRITIYLDDDVLAAFRDRAGREGKGYQTLINETLRAAIAPEAAPVTVESLRRVLREELRGAA